MCAVVDCLLILQFDVFVEDKGSQPLRNMSSIRVTITDVNDQVPRFTEAEYTFRLPENAAAQQILTLRYDDEDTLPAHTQSRLSIMSVIPPGMCLVSSLQVIGLGLGLVGLV